MYTYNYKYIVAAKRYLWISLFFAVFGGIYEYFSHGVYSYFMIYAFMIPLVLGTVLCLLLGSLKSNFQVAKGASSLWFAGVMTLTLGSVMKGVVEIYGTTNRLLIIYPIAGIIFLVGAILLEVVGLGESKAGNRKVDNRDNSKFPSISGGL